MLTYFCIFHKTLWLHNVWHQPVSILTTTYLFQTLLLFSPQLRFLIPSSVYKSSLFLVMKAMKFPITSYSKFWTLTHRCLPISTNLPAFPFFQLSAFLLPWLEANVFFPHTRWTFILKLNVILFPCSADYHLSFNRKAPEIPMTPSNKECKEWS